MASLFPPYANRVLRGVLAALVFAVFAVPLALMAWVRTPYGQERGRPVEQPVPFDHRHHVVDDGIDCRYCHTEVERSSTAGYPSSELCMNCHSQVWNDSPLLAPVRESFFRGTPIAWERVHRLPDFVYFDHSAHVNNGIGCESCHGRVDLMARVFQVAPLTMRWCLECHRDPVPHLRPRDAITTMGWDPGRAEPDARADLVAAYAPAAGVDCTTCHR